MLKVYFKRVEAVGTLMQLVMQSPDQVIRQLSCVYLRKVIVQLWPLVSQADQA